MVGRATDAASIFPDRGRALPPRLPIRQPRTLRVTFPKHSGYSLRRMETSERNLVEAAKKDPANFAALYDAHFERIYAFVVQRVRDRIAAEDITSEVFTRALAGIDRYEWRGIPFSSWLYRIASNEIADHASRGGARHDGNDLADPSEDEIASAERRATLARLVDTLPADQGRVIVARFAEERSIREIATDLGRSEGAIKQLQWRALQNLRARMERDHG